MQVTLEQTMNTNNWKRIVIKVGSALIAPNKDGCSSRYLLSIANFIAASRDRHIDVVLVSSGSVAAGSHLFKTLAEDNSVVLKKAMAAAGQSEMMATWDRLFDFNTAQLLLTHADLKDYARYTSIKETLHTLLRNGILPIVNENDAVTTDKLKVGDNDNLAAMVASALQADALIICSDIDGLFDANPDLDPNAKLINDVYDIDKRIFAMAGGAVSDVGTGGMLTKIQAAEKAVAYGIDTYIVNGFKPAAFDSLLAGNNPGTCFHALDKPLQADDHWIRHTVRAQGEIVVDNQFDLGDESPSEALSPVDLVDVSGDFASGDVVLIRKRNGERVAKAKTNYSSCLLSYLAETNSDKDNAQLEQASPLLSSKHITLLGS
jgi:glutamate 5-kinase